MMKAINKSTKKFVYIIIAALLCAAIGVFAVSMPKNAAYAEDQYMCFVYDDLEFDGKSLAAIPFDDTGKNPENSSYVWYDQRGQSLSAVAVLFKMNCYLGNISLKADSKDVRLELNGYNVGGHLTVTPNRISLLPTATPLYI